MQGMFRTAKLKAGVEDFHFHDIRAKALNDAKRLGIDPQKLAGHASMQTTEHYIKRRTLEKVAPIQERIKG
ncbi:MAG: tyrosine-type recombinase/integrase [Magnetococcales bacterium]|nr:tyrosine-type recombinase/integrase [Magnetococcales bacterium]